MRIMTHHRVRHLPVLENDRLVGVISIGDLVNAIIADQARTIDHLHSYYVATRPSHFPMQKVEKIRPGCRRRWSRR